MKIAWIILLLLSLATGCQKQPVDPAHEEVKATILGIVPPPLSRCSYAFWLQIGNENYSTQTIAQPYNQPGTRVLITYKPDATCSQSPYIIDILSIRKQ